MCLLANSKHAVMCLLLRSGFHLATTIKAWWVECCRNGCPSGMFFHLHRETLELCQSDHWVLGHLPDQDPSPSTVNCGTLYRQVCAFPNHVQSIEFTIGRNISRMINGNKMHLSSMSSLTAKGLNTYSGKKKYVNPLELLGLLHIWVIKFYLIFI
jgi:hypothetical protein